jgi:hypothetical protein
MGYVPEIQKLMLRTMRIDDVTGDRIQTQVSLSGIYITHEIIQMALERVGVDAYGMDKTQLHGAQILTYEDLMQFVSVLDEVASQEWCTPIFMGEPVDENVVKDYDAFKQEAILRQEGQHEFAAAVTDYVLGLAESGVDRFKAPAMVSDFVKRMLLNIAKDDLTGEKAKQMFDEKTAQGLLAVKWLEIEGKYGEAFEALQAVAERAPGGGSCGDGSCGLVGMNPFSGDGLSELKKLDINQGWLKAKGYEDGDDVVGDTVRACTKCRQKSVVYIFSGKKVTKACANGKCDATETKQTAVATQASAPSASSAPKQVPALV